MRRFLLLLLVLAALFAAARAVRELMLDDEARIRGLIEDMAREFDDGSAAGAVAGLARDWRDASTGLDRATLRAALARLFFQQGLSDAGGAWRVELPPEHFALALEPSEPDGARVACRARFFVAGAVEPFWVVAIEAELARGEDGWEVLRSDHRTLAGRLSNGG